MTGSYIGQPWLALAFHPHSTVFVQCVFSAYYTSCVLCVLAAFCKGIASQFVYFA